MLYTKGDFSLQWKKIPEIIVVPYSCSFTGDMGAKPEINDCRFITWDRDLA